MKKITVENKFLSEYWEELTRTNYIVKVSKTGHLFCIKNDFYMLPIENNINSNINSYKVVNEECVEDKISFINKIKRQKFYNISGFIEFNDFSLRFYKSLGKEEKKDFQSFISKIFLNLQFRILEISELFYKNLTLEEFLQWWDTLPPKSLKLNCHPNASDITKFIEKKFPEHIHHQLLVSLFTHRAHIFSRNEKISLQVRDLLIERYRHNENLLQDYNKNFPALKLYLEQQNVIPSTYKNENYLSDSYIKESFHIEVDVEKMKATLAIPSWTKNTYKSWLDILLKKIFSSYSCIKNIRTFYEIDPTTKKRYISIYVSKIEKDGISKNQIEEFIIKFFNTLKNSSTTNNANPKAKNAYVEKWYEMIKLSTQLTKKEEDRKISKI